MPTVVDAVRSKTLPGKIWGMDLTNDGVLVAVALQRADGGPSVQVYRTQDLSLQAEYAPNVVGRGVAFVADDSCLVYLTHTHAGASLFLVDDGAPDLFAEYPARQAEQLVRDRTGARLGIVGDSFLVWSAEKRDVIASVEGDAEQKGFLIHASFATKGNRVFLYGKAEGKLVLHDLSSEEDVDVWEAPFSFGQFLTSSPSDRYLVAIGYSGRGVFLVDTKERRTLATDFFNKDTFSDMHPMFAGDGSVLLTWAANAWLFAPPDFEWTGGPPMSGSRTSAAASAREAPMLAFGVDDNELRLVSLRSGGA